MPNHASIPLAMLAAAVLMGVGCTGRPAGPDPEVVAALRDRYVLEVEPADAVTLSQWRSAQLSSGEADADAVLDLVPTSAKSDSQLDAAGDARVVLVGRVGGIPSPFDSSVESEFPFRPGMAAFFLVDTATADDYKKHAGEEGASHAADCPFCSRKFSGKTEAVALVTFAGSDDDPAPVPAQQLFELETGDAVVVRGGWRLEGDLLMVNADGIYVRP